MPADDRPACASLPAGWLPIEATATRLARMTIHEYPRLRAALERAHAFGVPISTAERIIVGADGTVGDGIAILETMAAAPVEATPEAVTAAARRAVPLPQFRECPTCEGDGVIAAAEPATLPTCGTCGGTGRAPHPGAATPDTRSNPLKVPVCRDCGGTGHPATTSPLLTPETLEAARTAIATGAVYASATTHATNALAAFIDAQDRERLAIIVAGEVCRIAQMPQDDLPEAARAQLVREAHGVVDALLGPRGSADGDG